MWDPRNNEKNANKNGTKSCSQEHRRYAHTRPKRKVGDVFEEDGEKREILGTEGNVGRHTHKKGSNQQTKKKNETLETGESGKWKSYRL